MKNLIEKSAVEGKALAVSKGCLLRCAELVLLRSNEGGMRFE